MNHPGQYPKHRIPNKIVRPICSSECLWIKTLVETHTFPDPNNSSHQESSISTISHLYSYHKMFDITVLGNQSMLSGIVVATHISKNND